AGFHRASLSRRFSLRSTAGYWLRPFQGQRFANPPTFRRHTPPSVLVVVAVIVVIVADLAAELFLADRSDDFTVDGFDILQVLERFRILQFEVGGLTFRVARLRNRGQLEFLLLPAEFESCGD